MPRADRIPFVPGHALALVKVTFNATHDAFLVADTGASRTLISRRVADRLALDLSTPVRFEALAGVGRSQPVPVVRLDRAQVGASVVENLEAPVYDLPAAIRADGLLGLNFLRRFRATFAFDVGLLILRDLPPQA